MVKTNYGLDGPLGYKLPSIVCVWRWEVRDAYRDWLPRSAKEKAEGRIAERIQVCIIPKSISLTISCLGQDRPSRSL